jgi:hypothetical protein
MLPSRRTSTFLGLLTAALVLGSTAAAAVRAAPAPAAPFDVDGDGVADLVVGVPGESLGGKRYVGAINVLPGSSAGVTARGDRLVHQGTPGVVGSNEDGDGLGSSVTSGDFDGDGFADLAVGSAGENGTQPPPWGAVTILYGTADGVSGSRSQQLLPATYGVEDTWGTLEVTGDLDGDGYDDLVIAGSTSSGGTGPFGVTVVYGSAAGLDGSRRVLLTGASASGSSATGIELFGHAVATGDVTGDGADDLVISTVRDGRSGIYVFHGRHGDLSTRADEVVDQAALTTSGTEFTQLAALVVGDFDGDGHGDLALADEDAAAPGFEGCKDIAACPGAVLTLPGTSTGLSTSGRRLLFEGTPGVPGYARGGDAFGLSLAAGDLDADGFDDLAVGLPGDDTSRGIDVGAVDVLRGSANGLVGSGAQRWTQHTRGVPGAEERSDYFGRDLRIADMGRSAVPDLVVDANGEDVGSVVDAGSATVLYGRAGVGLVASGAQGWTQDNRGVAGAAESPDRFGVVLRQ